MQEDTLTVYTIYNNPLDFPGDYVISKWDTVKGSDEPQKDLNYMFVDKSLEPCRDELKRKGLYNLGRHADDDPCIVESWI